MPNDQDRDSQQAELDKLSGDAIYRIIVENNRQPIFVCDTKSRYLYANQVAASLLGKTPGELIGMTAADFFPADAAQRLQRSIDTIIATGKGLTHENPALLHGNPSVFKTSLEPIFNSAGAVIAVHANVTDVSSFYEQEKQLKRSEELLQASIELTELGIFEHDQIKNEVYWSPRQREIYGFGKDEKLVLEVFADILHPEDRAWVQASVQEAHDPMGDGLWEAEHRVILRDGTVHWLASRSRTFFEGSGPERHAVRTIGVTRDITEQKLAQLERDSALAALRKSEAHLEEAQRIARVGSWSWDSQSKQAIWSRELFILHGLDPDQSPLSREEQGALYSPESLKRLEEHTEFTILTGTPFVVELERINKKGPSTWLEARTEAEYDQDGNFIGLRGTVLDITASKNLQLQLVQAQKMESVGLLAGGIAHDFNNLLTVIQGYVELLQLELPPDTSLSHYLEEINKASGSAATLTEQLLAFSRKQIIAPKILNMNHVVEHMSQMLKRVLGEDIELQTAFTDDLWPVKFDPGQSEQIIMNLAINARDAMSAGGKLLIETANVHLDHNYARQHIDVLPGDYMMLAVSDTGTGMSDEVIKHVFDPFFTTKMAGKGTGLGLAMVYGAVKQNGGNIEIYSEPGLGSSFKIYLPRVNSGAVSPYLEKNMGLPGGDETIILVEDAPQVRDVATLQLERLGYQVHAFPDGVQAIQAVSSMAETPQLLITDVVMPVMTGVVLAAKISALKPGIKVLFASGYTANVIVHHGVLKDGVEFIAKPFTQVQLAHAVRAVLDRKS